MLRSNGRKYGKYLTGLLSLTDLLLVNGLFALTIVLCPELLHVTRLKTLWVLINTSYLPVMLWTKERGHQMRVLLMERVVRSSLEVVGIHALFFLSLVAFLDIEGVPMRAYFIFYGLMLVMLPLSNIFTRLLIKTLRRHGYNFTRVAIVGTGVTARRLLVELQSDAGFGYKVIGFYSDHPDSDFTGNYLGTVADLEARAKELEIDQIFYTLAGDDDQDTLGRVVKLTDNNMMAFYYVPRMPRRVARSFELHNIGAVPVLSLRRNPLNSILAQGLKRGFDFCFSTVVLLFSPIVLVPVAIAIKISSPGPIFFKQERTGYQGRTFNCWKFRTMRVNADANSQQARKDDPRTTKVGRFLRHSSIDELPQFWNVWKGDMSVVGPRPHMLKHTEEYTKLIDLYMVRHRVRPGITGWAQVNGYRGATDQLWKMERRVECDVWYIENWSFLLDLKIIVRTVMNAVGGEKNAY